MPVSPRTNKRVAPLAGERVGLDPPPSRGQLREPGPELRGRQLEPALEIDEPAERLEALRREDAGPSARDVRRGRRLRRWPLRPARRAGLLGWPFRRAGRPSLLDAARGRRAASGGGASAGR